MSQPQQPPQSPSNMPPQFQPPRPPHWAPQWAPQWQAQQDALRALVRRARRAYSRIGAGISVVVAIWLAMTLGLQSLAMYLMHSTTLSSWLALVINDVVLYCLAIPIGYMIISTVPVEPTHRYRLPARRFCALLVMCVPLMYGGSIIGQLLAGALSSGTSTNRIDSFVDSGSWLLTSVAMVVIAPIVEEWLFRKQVISRLRRYGERTAILVSALLFALFHVNLYQFFYAFALGLMFGYVYTRTSALRYSVAMHMIVNFVGAVISPALLQWTESTGALALAVNAASTLGAGGSPAVTGAQMAYLVAMCAFGLAMLALFVIGIVLLVRERRRFVLYTAPDELPRGTVATAVFANPGMIVFLVIGVIGTLVSVWL
ncbi:MAG: CPBP family intramembrane glutamic endopeptidase [Bifidobacterium sp.]|nr:CPBP family intramembrane glutamic endopeptidase [Bifidobacterium sp.]